MNSRALLLLLLCAASVAAAAAAAPVCEQDHVRIDADFPGGDLDQCRFTSPHSVELTFRPEDHKVSDAFSWFAIRVVSDAPTTLALRLRFPDSYPRFWPKLSRDGQTWVRAADAMVATAGKNMTVTVTTNAGPLWIAAQELLTQDWYDAWITELAGRAELAAAVIGTSVEGRPIQLLKSGNRREAILLLGRQHPVEVPGALAMRDFVDTLLADTELARQFRARFTLLIVPLLNPDGVANGHSRHNAARTDLNRDWGTFTQPETQAIARLLASMQKLDMRPRLMLDFHATKMTQSLLFYAQASDETTDPPGFAENWFAAVRARLPQFEFEHLPQPSMKNPNTKGYFYRQYGIPAYTYELGDEADRAEIHSTTPVFAEEMMRVMLESR